MFDKLIQAGLHKLLLIDHRVHYSSVPSNLRETNQLNGGASAQLNHRRDGQKEDWSTVSHCNYTGRVAPRSYARDAFPMAHAVSAPLTAFFRSAFGRETSSNTWII
jgi:hypothetical protein